MKSNRLLATLGSCILLAASPALVWGQTTTTTATTAPATTTTTTTSPVTTSPTTQSGTRSTTNTNTSSTGQTTTFQSSTIGTGSATTIPSNANNIGPWYGDPYSMGMPTKFATGTPSVTSTTTKPTVTFGKGNYVSTTNTTATAPAATTTTQQNGFTTVGYTRNPQYTTVLSEDVPLVVHKTANLQANLRDVIARSTKLKNKEGIQLAVVDGGGVILTGQVGSDRERQLVEAMIGMTPGVRGVQNNLTVR